MTPAEAFPMQTEEPQEVYDEIIQALKGINAFLSDHLHGLRSGFDALRAVVPQIGHVNESLIFVMNAFRSTIDHIDMEAIPNLSDLSKFAHQIRGFMEAVGQFLPADTGAVSDVARTTRVMAALPALEQGKGSILALTDDIIRKLRVMQEAGT